MPDDLWRLRIAAASRPPAPSIASGGAPALVGKVLTTTVAAGKYFRARPEVVAGTESEGSSGVFAEPFPAAEVVALNLGPGTLAAGDYQVLRFVDYRWVTGRKAASGGGGNGGVGIPNCFCLNLPTTLNLTNAAVPDPSGGEVRSCTIVWGAPPGALVAAGGSYSNPGYYSTSSFTDGTGISFYHGIQCNFNVLKLVQYVYDPPAFVGPNVVFQWTITGNSPPNPCSQGGGSAPSCNMTAGSDPSGNTYPVTLTG